MEHVINVPTQKLGTKRSQLVLSSVRLVLMSSGPSSVALNNEYYPSFSLSGSRFLATMFRRWVYLMPSHPVPLS